MLSTPRKRAPDTPALSFPLRQVLERLAGPAPVPLDDRLWQSVLGFTTPASRFDPAEVEATIKPHLASLGG